MRKFLGKAILKIIGWKVVLDGDADNLDRCILVVVPHTHNSDYLIGNFAYMALGKDLRIIIKDKHTRAWYGGLVKSIGGIGIDRSRKNDLVNFVAEQLENKDFSLVIAPEGTRTRVERWRSGFYQMALAAKVPIVIGAGDYAKKTVYLGYKIPYERILELGYAGVLQEISDYVEEKNLVPAVPENWNPNFTIND